MNLHKAWRQQNRCFEARFCSLMLWLPALFFLVCKWLQSS
ncbi:hypothetical protein CFP56_041109 [Quercus suber]|uniref:Uncharacterized protein n=1 Tax=Quercus suber TaxID=58331 RepID=A0AAW0IX84_QUESU